MPITRRTLLQRTLVTPLAITSLAQLQGCAEGTVSLCSDPDTLTRGEAHMRKTLEYIAVSTNTSETCSNCQFFRGHAQTGDGACGECEILSGAVEASAYCTSWALKS